MPLNFDVLCPKIERIIDKLERAFRSTPGLILTEDDLKCLLFRELFALQELRAPVPTQDEHIMGTYVHSELTWYGESINGRPPKLEIKPDITILDPEHLSILHGYMAPGLVYGSMPCSRQRGAGSFSKRFYASQQGNIDLFSGAGSIPSNFSYSPQLPSKQFEFGGKAITFELKFARKGITPNTLKLIKEDYDQIQRLFRRLDRQGVGDTVFSYLIIFDKYQHSLNTGAFANFLRSSQISNRHKIIYKSANVQR